MIDVLEARGLGISGAQRERILECSDPDTLARWHRLAVGAGSTDALFE